MSNPIESSGVAKPRFFCAADVLPSLLFSITIGFFAPLESYFSMIEELWFPITDVLLIAPLCTAFLFAVGFGICKLFRGKLRIMIRACLIAASVCLLLQGLFMNADYGMLNGTPIKWNSFGTYPLINTLIWAAVFALAIFFALFRPVSFAPASRFVCIMLVLMQVFSLSAQALTTDFLSNGKSYYLSNKNEFRFSKNNNVIVFGIDSFTPDLLDEMLTLYPESFKDWTGFVNFPNNIGIFPHTKWAVRNLFTGKVYNPSVPEGEFMKDAYQNSTFLPTLKQNDYLLDLYSPEAVAPVCEGLVDNYTSGTLHVDSYYELFKKMYRITGFRYAPHLAKRFFWMNSADFNDLDVHDLDDHFTRNDAEFRQRFDASGITVDLDQNVFRFYFLWGPHLPFILETPQKTTYYSNDYVTQHSQTLCAFDSITAVMNAMKAEGVYDDATIIIFGDHGDMFMDSTPILLVKAPGATGPLTQCDSFVSQDDFQATVYALAGIDATAEKGTNVFDVGDEKRTFTFCCQPNGTSVEYLYDVTMLENGIAHFEQQDIWYDETGAHDVSVPTVRTDVVYQTPTASQLLPYCDYMDLFHIYDRAEGGAWLCKPSVTLRVRLQDDAPESLAIKLGLSEVMNGSQRVVVSRRETTYDTLSVTSDMSELVIPVPADAINDGELVLELRFPDAMSVYAKNGYQNHSDDYFRQSIAVTSLTFTQR